MRLIFIFCMVQRHYLVIPLITVAVAVLGSWFTSMGVQTWYPELVKPELTPPNNVFGPVWTIIYVLTTLSVILVWDRVHEKHNWLWRWWHKKQLSVQQWRMHAILILFIANALLNVLWSYFFFGQQLFVAALADMMVLNLTTIVLMVLIWPLSRVASLLLAPYVIWVSFATVLTYQLMVLN